MCGLLAGAKDAPLRIAFPLGETERLFPNLWAPSGVGAALARDVDVEEALREPEGKGALPCGQTARSYLSSALGVS